MHLFFLAIHSTTIADCDLGSFGQAEEETAEVYRRDSSSNETQMGSQHADSTLSVEEDAGEEPGTRWWSNKVSDGVGDANGGHSTGASILIRDV